MTAFARLAAGALALAGIPILSACGDPIVAVSSEEHGEQAAFERGPHRGRMLRDGELALEVTIFEDGVPPEFRLYAFLNDRPVDPEAVDAAVALTRLGGRVDRFAFQPEGDFLRGDGVVREPHSFDVKVEASHAGATHAWSYESYEGRTTIAASQAEAAGIAVETAGPAMIKETVVLTGRAELLPQGRSEVRAWYPGRILEMTKVIGDRVEKGEMLARVESTESLQTYEVPAPISGIVMVRNANAGDVAATAPLYVIEDATQMHAEFFAFPRDAGLLAVGQPVAVRNLMGDRVIHSEIEAILPTTDLATQTTVIHVDLPNPDLVWRPGQALEGSVVVGAEEVPLAVRTRALQRFRDFMVVYAQVDETYEVRMLELGRQTPEWTEVLSGLEPGTEYVSDNAFLIRADVEKSGATHDH